MDLVTIWANIQDLDQRLKSLEGSPVGQYIACRAYSSVDVNHTPSGSFVVVALDSESFDYGACHDLVTNNSRLTAPVDGLYVIGCEVDWDVNAVGVRSANLKVDGTTYIAATTVAAYATYVVPVQTTAIYYLAAGHYVELVGFQDSGGALLMKRMADHAPCLWMVKVG